MEVGAENNISTVYKEKPEIPQIETWAKHLNRSLTHKWPVNMGKGGQCHYSSDKCKLKPQLDIFSHVSE